MSHRTEMMWSHGSGGRGRGVESYIYNCGRMNEGGLTVGPSIGKGGGGERQGEVSWYYTPTVESRVTLRGP